MSDRFLTPIELRRAGLRALVQALGPIEAIRFLQQFDGGSGDYTIERHELLGDPSVEEVLSELTARQQDSKGERDERR